MNKLASTLAAKLGFPEIQVEQTLDALRFHVSQSLQNGETVRIPDFVVFDFKDKEERLRRNPRTGENVLVEAGRVPKVRFSASFKNAIQPLTIQPSIPNLTPPPVPLALPPLPEEREFFLTSGERKRESELLKIATPEILIWHPDFGQQWKKASEVFSQLQQIA
jgi:nucleoid DNA-binding protein